MNSLNMERMFGMLENGDSLFSKMIKMRSEKNTTGWKWT